MAEQHGSILVVDDEPDMLAGLGRILRLDGYKVELVETAKGLLARSNWSDYLAIILDRRLADGTADELLPKLNELAPDVPVVVVTGFADLDGALVALRYGAEDYLIKPVNPEALRATLRRIAERTNSANILQESEERFRLLVDGVKDYAIFMLDKHGHVASWNAGAERIKGYSNEEIVGKHFSCFYPAEDVQNDKPAVELEIALTAGRYEEEGWRVRKDGSRFYANVVITPILKDQRLSGFAKVTRDITEKKRAQEELLRSERLSGIGEAMAGLVHESRNALNVTQSALNMIERRTEGIVDVDTFIEGARDAQSVIQRLFDEVRVYSAPVIINHETCNVAELLEQTWKMLQAPNENTTSRLNQRTCEPPPECDACPIKLAQVFRNLFENSVAACDEPVEIEVDYKHTEVRGNPALRVVVTDNGPGLNAEQRAQIFEAFYTTKTHGTGLGLAISKRIIEAHGGTITLGDANGSGAQFIITLPIKKS